MLETKLRDAFDSMPDGMLLIDAQDRIVAWNPAYARFVVPDVISHIQAGIDFRDALRIVARIRGSLTDAAAIEAVVEARLARRRQPGVPFDSQRPNGRIMQIVEQRMPDGGWVVNYRDVTDERSATAALALAKSAAERAETQFHEGVESMLDGFAQFDADQRLVTWNSRYTEMFPHLQGRLSQGITLPEVFRLHAHSPLYAIPAAERDAWVARAMDTVWDKPQTNLTRALSDGRAIWGLTTRPAAGGIIFVLRDVTAERRALEGATVIAAEYRDGIESMLDAFAQYDSEQCLIRWNRRYETMLPHLEGKLYRGIPLTEILRIHARSELYRIPLEEEEAWIARSVTAVWDAPTPNSTTRELADGRTIWGLNTRVGSGGMIFLIRDITERLAQEKRLAEALEREQALSAQQRRFVAITAHEFRTPLTIIDGAAQRLVRSDDGVSPEELRMRVARIRAAVSRMSQLIDSTLNLARLESGQIACSPTPLDLGTLVSGICRRLEGLAPGFTIAIVLPAVPLIVPADASLIDQVVTNLLSNAIKYSGDSRRIEVTVDAEVDQARVAVRDFGVGIPEAELAQIFGRFFRASTAKGLPGTGIGLELVRELVALHGGKVAVQSRVGEGSCFTVSLPLAGHGRDAAPPACPAPQAARG